MIEACNACKNNLFLSESISNTIFSQISLSEIIPIALKTINTGIGCLTRGNSTQIAFPKPLFLDDNIIFICFGEIHLKSGTDLISAFQVYLVSFLEILKQ